jgi:hypothetical protein
MEPGSGRYSVDEYVFPGVKQAVGVSHVAQRINARQRTRYGAIGLNVDSEQLASTIPTALPPLDSTS